MRIGTGPTTLLSGCGIPNYSLHHLSQSQKKQTLAEICRVLKPDGSFVWTDIVLEEDEVRQGSLKRLERIMRNWTGLTPAQIERGIAHIWDSDFPESFAWMSSQLAKHGWKEAKEILRNETFGSWVFHQSQ